jgi:hypothetical protein
MECDRTPSLYLLEVTIFLNDFLALKAGIVVAAMVIFSSVLGWCPSCYDPSRFSKRPNTAGNSFDDNADCAQDSICFFLGDICFSGNGIN